MTVNVKFHRLVIGLFVLYISLTWASWTVNAARTANIVWLSTIHEIDECEFDDLSEIDNHVLDALDSSTQGMNPDTVEFADKCV